MVDINSRESISQLDLENVLGSVEALPDQCLDAYEKANLVNVPEEFGNIENLVMAGMGGSGLGARVIESVYFDTNKFPLVRVNDYNIPNFVNENSLVICSSYSGTTEETLENVRQALERKAKWMAIGTGGTLIDEAKKHGVPYYQIDPKFNPSNQPRMAIGYSIVGQLVLASKLGLFDFTKDDLDQLVIAMKSILEKNSIEINEADNAAKKLARLMYSKNIFYISASHLTGATHTINNQLNENAKTFSADFTIPELNHHLMEGLMHPSTNSQNLFMLFVNSNLYSDKINKRFGITKDVVEKNNLSFYHYTCTAQTKLSQAFELIQFGALANFYLSMLYEQNPAPIPWVDYFKTRMGQPLGKN
ncbi:hypothetical protein IPM62_03700 [Candidatus Woesebacteria bacterium]|nr:MAG: hypothetical protein IPM62_03700 [Candidatus Woesebacteria bacterium]